MLMTARSGLIAVLLCSLFADVSMHNSAFRETQEQVEVGRLTAPS